MFLPYRSALFDEGGFGAGTSTDRSTNPFDNDPAEDWSFNEIRQQQQQIIRGNSCVQIYYGVQDVIWLNVL